MLSPANDPKTLCDITFFPFGDMLPVISCPPLSIFSPTVTYNIMFLPGILVSRGDERFPPHPITAIDDESAACQ